jgi:FAD/FMN-containing dehydrogenase
MSQQWTNWSGSVRAEPRERVRPASEAELADCVTRAAKLRVVGAGHSFTPLCETTGTLLDLSGLPETVQIDPDARAPGSLPAVTSSRLHLLGLFDLQTSNTKAAHA